MKNQIEQYFELTFPSYFTKKLQDWYNQRSQLQTSFSLEFFNLERKFYQLYRDNINKVDYLNVVKACVQNFMNLKFQNKQILNKVQLQIKICLMIFMVWIQEQLKQLVQIDIKFINETDLENTLKSFKITCQLSIQWEFDSFFEDLFLQMKDKKNKIRSRIIQTFQNCGIQKNCFLIDFKDTPMKIFQMKKDYIQQQTNTFSNAAQFTMKKQKKFNLEAALKITKQDNTAKKKSENSQMNLNSKFSKNSYSHGNRERTSPSGRTIYMAHPMKYIKKHNKNVKKIYHYVQKLVEIN